MSQSDSFTKAMKALNIEAIDIDSLDLNKLSYHELANAKRNVEDTLESLFALLTHEYKFDMTLPLVIDGFPRNDVDVVSIRLLRTKIIRLRNDHQKILEQIDVQLKEKIGRQGGMNPEVGQENESFKTPQIPFALVKSVVKNSPSDQAGLISGDRIVSFDETINAANHERLTSIAKRVSECEDKTVKVAVVRGAENLILYLTPTDKWGGQGLIGCHIVPI